MEHSWLSGNALPSGIRGCFLFAVCLLDTTHKTLQPRLSTSRNTAANLPAYVLPIGCPDFAYLLPILREDAYFASCLLPSQHTSFLPGIPPSHKYIYIYIYVYIYIYITTYIYIYIYIYRYAAASAPQSSHHGRYRSCLSERKLVLLAEGIVGEIAARSQIPL